MQIVLLIYMILNYAINLMKCTKRIDRPQQMNTWDKKKLKIYASSHIWTHKSNLSF